MPGIFSRQLLYSISVVSISLAKVVRIYGNRNLLSPSQVLLWSPTFFVQDLFVLFLLRMLTGAASRGIPRAVAAVSAFISSVTMLFMSSVTISFYIITATQIHWRHVRSFPKDAAGLRTLLYGSTACMLVALSIVAISLVFTPHLYQISGQILRGINILQRPTDHFANERILHNEKLPTSHKTQHHEDAESVRYWRNHLDSRQNVRKPMEHTSRRHLVYCCLLLLILLRFARPHDAVYSYLSWTLPLLPSSGELIVDHAAFAESNYFRKCKAPLAPAPNFSWLPQHKLLGFEDWYAGPDGSQPLHYSPAEDCLHVSNLNQGLLPSIASAIDSHVVKVKHIIVVKLESTRKDVFPLAKDGFTFNRIVESHPDHQLTPLVEQNLSELTKTAEYLTGEYTGFETHSNSRISRGGISATNAITTASYTLKSVTGTLCGISPLVADFHQEYRSHIYQPCLAHILEAFNQGSTFDKTKMEDFTSWPWQSLWMQSVTNAFDNQANLTTLLGFKDDISKNVLTDPTAPHFPPKSADINYYGLPETELKPYLRDAVEKAERNKERLFLTHLTSTTHHPWNLPKDTPRHQYMGSIAYGMPRKLDRYLNTIGFVDNWLGEILSVLEDTGVANETLLVVAGDHGLNLPFDGSSTTYESPHVGSFHIPLVFSHPALPAVQIEDAVSTNQILPTILDLLITSSSLSKEASKAASDLLPLYEGQSLLRPLSHAARNGQRSWQFSLICPGGSWLAARSMGESFRLAVPLNGEAGWRFSDLDSDPNEFDAILRLDWLEFVRAVRQQHGSKVIKWVEDAAAAAGWWVSTNRQLWRWDETQANSVK